MNQVDEQEISQTSTTPERSMVEIRKRLGIDAKAQVQKVWGSLNDTQKQAILAACNVKLDDLSEHYGYHHWRHIPDEKRKQIAITLSSIGNEVYQLAKQIRMAELSAVI